MRTKTRPFLIALLSLTVALAGCTGDDAGTDSVGTDGSSQPKVSLGANEGAISGLIVDDNYRPVQLKEDWGAVEPGDFQDVGFVLVQETGQRFETSENGEFTALPLTPGTYTIRVAADNHEAISQTVNVVAGEYTEVTLEARRTASNGGTILSEEEVLFMTCYGSFYFFQMAVSEVVEGCGFDLSGDSSRFDFDTDYSAINDIIRGVVTEMRASQEAVYSVTVRIVDGSDELCQPYCEFLDLDGEPGQQYLRGVMYPNRQHIPGTSDYLEAGEDGYCAVGIDMSCENYGYTAEYEYQTGLFASPETGQYFEPTCGPTEETREELYYNRGVNAVPLGCGAVGGVFGVKAQFLQTVFLYDLPEEGIEDFCALCEDADIPE